ncbi:MAG TPA: hypothetical protein VF720_03530 [Candidatus Eisenbacteria bacterium]
MTDPDPEDWPVSFEANARDQRRRMARLSFAEKLDWLESAHELARHLAGKASGGASVAQDLERTPSDE